MSPRNKLILLAGLVVLLVIVAYLQLGRSKPQAHNENASPPVRSTPATTSAPAGAGAEARPADSAQDPGPSADDLRELADWFGVLRPVGAGIVKGGAPVFGIALKTALSTSPDDVDAPSQEPEPGQIPWTTEPGSLDGIIKVGNGPGKAFFQGELYQVGDRVRGTTFTIVSVDDDSVTLKSGDRVIQRFWHD
jgi:hypothetical protein